MRRWIAFALVVGGASAILFGITLVSRAFDFPGPTKKVEATVLNSRAASCDVGASPVRVRLTLDGDEHVAELQEESECTPTRHEGDVIRVYVLSAWPEFVGACEECLPVDEDDAPGVYLHQLSGVGVTAIGLIAAVAGLILAAIDVSARRRARRVDRPNRLAGTAVD